jgi:hypothetical protein
MALANLNTADFIQGSGVSQTGNVIDVTGGGGGALDDLTDVTITAPSDGEVLTYDNVTGEWVNAAPTGGAGLTEEQADQLELAYLRSIYYLAFK